MKTTIEQQPIRINGITFLEFMDKFRGKRIIDKYDKEVPKFVLFWSRKSITHILENYNLIDRE